MSKFRQEYLRDIEAILENTTIEHEVLNLGQIEQNSAILLGQRRESGWFGMSEDHPSHSISER